ncbi:wd40 repeat-containing protein [Leptolyngbya sp. Heron Island J]|uniref:toll/interleukin-1 receptor domain-containing protein n=1 Tax=Leptolyngbya sp. Heron Island J TaxID=1385935 RepID=UPI0003B9C07D|nr:TIR domain-containing protein [Leptolyngbya sp. Heron Island J]ESA33390.1 wd40 repeat-containing protein [Leptolyngbya sp. Heron Island J]
MTDIYDVFVSYGRADSKDFVITLCNRLTEAGHRVWCDFNDIPLAVDFQNQIDSGIEKSHNFLFVISPHSVNSAYCAKEIEIALRYQKRIIPVLHVEQIERGIWQSRHPNGTDGQWHDYQAKGLHSSFDNMNPQISKINWVYMRADQDDFEQSLIDLKQIFHRHQDYVENHTRFLNDALAWERQQKQTEFLLLGETRQLAETWLKQLFKSEQPPCIPTDLHGEFITESIKNANNMMTQVFLAYAQADAEVMDSMRRALWRQGFTVWSSQTDIPTGEAFKQAVNRGIEEADSMVYLLSSDALKSKYCQYELKYALALNKRIIPLLVNPLGAAESPSELASLQYIDLTSPLSGEEYQLDDRDLIKALNEDAVYYNQHKILLVKALKWKRQHQNSSVLLRGYDLRHAEAWLKTAVGHASYPATTFHREFIQASLDQPPPSSVDVFISYSSADADIARKLNSALQSQGKTTWFDQESIAAGTANFQREIYQGIEISDNFLFVLSPRSVNSPYCKLEVDHGARFNKRFVTILHQPVNTGDLHPQLAKVQWLDFSQQRGNFTTHFSHLIRTLDTDRAHVQSHTKWLQRALEWQQKDHSDDVLLRGAESAIASQWLQDSQTHQKTPAVTPEQQAFITASQSAVEAEAQREKRRMVITQSLLAGMSVLFLIAAGASALAFRNNSRLVLDKRAAEVSRALITQPVEGLLESLQLTRRSQTRLRELRPAVRSTLRNAIGVTVEKNRLSGHQQAVWSAVYSPDGQTIASGGFDDVVRLWNQDGTIIGEPFEGHTDDIWSVAFSPDGQTIASASSDMTVRLWDLQGNPIGNPLANHWGHVKTVAFSPNGSWIVSGDQGGAVRLWNRQGKLLSPPWQADGQSIVWSVAFSPDSTQIVSGRQDGLIHLWSPQGQLLNTLRGHRGSVNSVAFSPDGRLIASGGNDKIVRIWDRQGNLLHQLEGHTDNVMSLAFSPNSQWLISGADDNTVRVWSRDGLPVGPPLMGHEYYVYAVAVSPDGATILSGSEDNTLRLWDMQTALQRQSTRLHASAVNAMALSDDKETLVTASDDRTVKILNSIGETLVPPLTGHTDAVLSVDISPDGQTVVSGSADTTVKLWNRQGNAIATLNGHEAAVNAVVIHPTQPLMASASDDKTIRLWDLQGNPVGQPLTGHDDEVNALVFSPDGQLLASASDDRTIRLWDTQGNPMGDPMEGHLDHINALAFSPDSEMLISASRDRTLRLWGRDGRPLTAKPFNGHLSDVVAVTFSVDGQYIVSASRDQTLRLWDLSGEPIGNPLRGHNATASTVLFGADGQWILSANSDGFLRRWEGGRIQSWLEWGCDRIRQHSILQTPNAAGIEKVCRFE